MDFDEFLDTVERLSTANNIEAIQEICRFFCRQFGLDWFVYALRIPTYFSESPLVGIDGYPEKWVEHYLSNNYHDVDPVIDHCRHSVLPIQWHDIPLVSGSASERMMQEAGDFGLKDGITMPVHCPHGEFGVLSFALDRPPASARKILRLALPCVPLFAVYLHSAVIHALKQNQDDPHLSQREIECLRWAADGKTAWEISKILNISERTVTFHFNSVVHKLGVSNRQQAIAKAILLRLITPRPF